MKEEIPVTEADLHAYVDGQLPAQRHALVEQWLQQHPEDRKRVEQYRALSEQLRRRFDPIAGLPVPPAQLDAARTLQRPGRHKRARKALIAATFFLFGLLTGWQSHLLLKRDTESFMLTNLVRPAAFAHSIYTTDESRPVEIDARRQARLIDWLSTRLRTRIKAPNLSTLGYRLIGGRLIPSTNRMAAQFMYENADGIRVTLYVRRVSRLRHKKIQDALRYFDDAGLRVFFWRKGELGFAVTGRLDRKTLNGIAAQSRQQT